MEHRDVSRRTLLKGGVRRWRGCRCRWPARRTPFRASPIERNTRGMTTARCVATAGTARRRGPPVARPAAAGSLPGHRRKPAGLGGARLLADPSREVPLRHSLRRTDQWPGRRGSWHVGVSGLVAKPLSLTLADLQGPPAPRGGLHARVLGQPRPPRCHRLHRQCPLGRHPARSGAGGSAVS